MSWPKTANFAENGQLSQKRQTQSKTANLAEKGKLSLWLTSWH
jgi:hypothetical protein